MNKRFYTGLLAAMLLLSGCSKPVEETPVQNATVVEQPPVQSGILSDVGQAETLQEYYDRTAIIGRNEWMEGSFIQTENWAREYAALEYPGGTVTVEFNSGYVLPDAMTKDHLSGGVALWDVTVQWPDQPTVWETVQVFYFTESGETGQKQCFSGLLTGEEILKTKPETYAYLALDTRFAGRMQNLPDLTVPEGVQTLELNFFVDGIHPQDCQVWMLTSADAIILSRYKEGELPMGNYTLTAYNLDTGVIDWELSDLEGIWNFDSLQNGVLTLRQFLRQGEGRVLRVWMEEDRPQWGLFDAPLEETLFAVGDYILTWQDGSILLGEEVLLSGGYGEEEEDLLELTMYNFHQALDDHRFLFSKAGWEWIEYYGVYDLETREAHPLVSDRQDWGFAVLQVSEDGNQALAGCTVGGLWNLALADLNRLTLHKILPQYGEEENALSQVVANGDLSRVAVLVEEEGVSGVRLYDTATGVELFRWEIPASLAAGQPTLQLVGEDTLVVSLRQYKTDTDWLYRVQY